LYREVARTSVSLPGPSGALLVLGLLAVGVAATVLGEAVRLVAARWVDSWTRLEVVERGLLDFFLGGAALYLLAALPVGGFSLGSLLGLVAVGAVGVAWTARRRARSLTFRSVFGPLFRPAAIVAEVAGLALLLLEVTVALPVGTGNTYDSSLLTFYTARLLDGHQLALSFLPSASVGILYPQGTTVWLGTAQLLLGLPGARTTLLVTPLFFGLAPVGGFVLGRRLLGGDLGGLSFALVLTAIASWTRVLVAGSNDFVFAFPLVLWLAGQAVGWMRSMPTPADAVGFGAVLGYSAALNPVGAQWLVPALLLMGALSAPRFAGSARRWLARWGTSILTALVPLVPTWYVLGRGLANPGYLPGEGPGAATSSASATSRFVGYVDPYLFGPHDVWLSPVPALRAEIAVLFTLGLALLFLAGRATLGERIAPLATFLFAAVLSTVGLLAIIWAGSQGGPLGALSRVLSEAESSIWLLTFYALIATLPLLLALEWATRANRPALRPDPPSASPRARGAGAPTSFARAALPVVLVLVIVVPGAVLTPTQLPPVLSTLYTDFGNVTDADFALLEYAGAHLPSGARVLVAPGSAGQFLPAYDPNAVVLFPMFPDAVRANASYGVVVDELTNATLDAGGRRALEVLGVQYVVVTPANTLLWAPFSAKPLLGAGFPVLFEDGPDYLFGLPPAAPLGPPAP
jgi:hypothetical protein